MQYTMSACVLISLYHKLCVSSMVLSAFCSDQSAVPRVVIVNAFEDGTRNILCQVSIYICMGTGMSYS